MSTWQIVGIVAYAVCASAYFGACCRSAKNGVSLLVALLVSVLWPLSLCADAGYWIAGRFK